MSCEDWDLARVGGLQSQTYGDNRVLDNDRIFDHHDPHNSTSVGNCAIHGFI